MKPWNKFRRLVEPKEEIPKHYLTNIGTTPPDYLLTENKTRRRQPARAN
jgi:hypothetical protein